MDHRTSLRPGSPIDGGGVPPAQAEHDDRGAEQPAMSGGGSTSPVIWLVRHGRTARNAAGRLRGHDDVPLDEVGVEEARRLAEFLTASPLSWVVTSPLTRALQTATAIAAPHGVEIEIDENLVDRDYGPWTGRRESELIDRFGSLDGAPGVEPIAAVTRALHCLAVQGAGVAPGEAIALVAHDAVNRAMLGQLRRSGTTSGGDIAQRTGCANRLEYDGERWAATMIDVKPG